ncbi:hypothetical protein CUMW_270640 [Citrus unshiu]|uniref:Uncharacterized protein n=1 Tax=Citrus unshiu TaxID=55188 RepID=A0A2H5QXC1_CITUN|nr:hypothetical protein CUMW_270640 [Citrus unshiu]
MVGMLSGFTSPRRIFLLKSGFVESLTLNKMVLYWGLFDPVIGPNVLNSADSTDAATPTRLILKSMFLDNPMTIKLKRDRRLML